MLLDRVWITYLTIVLLVSLVTPGGGDPAHARTVHLVVHGSLLAGHLAVTWACRRLTERSARLLRSGAALVSLPIVFSGMAWLLPAVHPQPYEWTWILWDRAVFGTDPTVALQALANPWFTEILQWIYATFYLIPIAAIVLAGTSSGSKAYDRALFTGVFGFLVSYLGYMLWPTLPPYRFLDHGGPLQGVWLQQAIHAVLDTAEANRWDCFPSGHTMLSVVSLALLWRWARPWFWVFLPLVTLLVLSTMVLRYHFFCDVAAGLLFVWPTLWAARRLCP